MKLREIILLAVLMCSTAYASYIIPNGSVTNAKLAPQAVQSPNVAPQAILQNNLGPRTVQTPAPNTSPAPAGGIALSPSCVAGCYVTNSAETAVSTLTVTLVTTGRPVYIGLIPDGSNNQCSIQSYSSGGSPTVSVYFLRNGSNISYQTAFGGISGSNSNIPATAFNTIDLVSAGTYTYSVSASTVSGSAGIGFFYLKLIAYEL